MDIARPDLARKKKLRHSLYTVAALTAVAVITVGVSRLEPAAPQVDRDTIYLDTVQRGPMVRQVRGTGTLVPEQIRWIPATTDGAVERIVIRPGALVTPDTVIVELSNPELEQTTLEARLNLDAAEARYSNRQVEVERELLNQRAVLATIEAQLKTARLQADADEQLFGQGLVSSLELQKSRAAVQEYDTRFRIERERLQMATDTVEAQLAVEQAEVDRLRTLYELRRQQVADLHVRAGMRGVLQQVPLGLSTNFFVLQSQRDLATAQDAELRAILDYQRARIEFERTQRASLGAAGIALVGGAMAGGPVGSARAAPSGPLLTPQR